MTSVAQLAASQQPLFLFSGDSLHYRQQTILRDVSIQIFSGESVALIGKSGSGKSTLLKAMRSQHPITTAWSPQEAGLVPVLSVFHNIYMGGLQRHSSLYNLANLLRPFPSERKAVAELLEKLQLSEKINTPVDNLSGGQQQRVAIGRALFMKQAIFLGDEPVSALDDYQSDHILSLLCHHHQTLVLALHDIDQALKTCQRVIGLKNGRIALDIASNQVSKGDLAFLYE